MKTPLTRNNSRGFLNRPAFWIAVFNCGFFAFMAFQLYQRESRQKIGVRTLNISEDLLSVTWVNYDQFMKIERNGEEIGAYILQVERDDLALTYDMYSRTRMKIKAFGQEVPVAMDLYIFMNELFEMQTFQAEVTFFSQKITIEAFTEGTKLYYRMSGPPELIRDGEAASFNVLEQPVMLADAIMPVVTQSDRLRVGKVWQTMASDPLQGRYDIPVTVEVVGKEEYPISEDRSRTVYRVEETVHASADMEIKTVSLYDPLGKVLRTENEQTGLVMIRVNQDEVYEKYRNLETPPNFEDITEEVKEEIRSQAIEQTEASDEPIMPWLPSM